MKEIGRLKYHYSFSNWVVIFPSYNFCKSTLVREIITIGKTLLLKNSNKEKVWRTNLLNPS